VLRIEEHPKGVAESYDLQPSATDTPVKDITFEQIEGDFQVYRGLWRIAYHPKKPECDLVYVLSVKPQPWLPTGLVMNRVKREVRRNLACVRLHSERMRQLGGRATFVER